MNHVDAGVVRRKSTLANRLIQRCGGLRAREMEVSSGFGGHRRARNYHQGANSGVEIQSAGRQGLLNLIDTPGHVDFS
jgi:GTP-binding protein LepA